MWSGYVEGMRCNVVNVSCRNSTPSISDRGARKASQAPTLRKAPTLGALRCHDDVPRMLPRARVHHMGENIHFRATVILRALGRQLHISHGDISTTFGAGWIT